jgi:hypothetical protein
VVVTPDREKTTYWGSSTNASSFVPGQTSSSVQAIALTARVVAWSLPAIIVPSPVAVAGRAVVLGLGFCRLLAPGPPSP